MGRTPPLVRSALTFVVLLVALSACGGGDNGEDVGASSATSAETTPTGESDTVAPPGTFALEDGALATGAEGLPVRRLQEALLVLGFDPGAVDGVFGPATRRAVMDFQRESGLEADGIVGQQTADAISEALESRTTTDN
jgi:peptidoglycan hydrolase-like protein with peptidoglycan-binding domain